MSIVIIIFLLCFALIAWWRFYLGLFFLFLFLPAYLIRFYIGPLPTTLLEAMIWLVFIIHIIKTSKPPNIQTYKQVIKRNPSLFIAIFLFLLAATISIFTSIDTRAALGEWKAFYI